MRALLLAARSIAYSRSGASGIIAAKLVGRLGLAELGSSQFGHCTEGPSSCM
jgi:hypothetical protein